MQANRAWRIHSFGGPEVLQLDQVDAPKPGTGEVLVKVAAAGVNGIDWKYRAGLMQKIYPIALPAALGAEMAGSVSAVGAGVSRFKPGDRVMGVVGRGAFADWIAVDENALCLTPDGLSDVDAASLPVAALTAWAALHAAGDLAAGTKVLIHGASGGVGGFSVQFAKAAGATVIATASANSRDYLLGLGADRVIDRKAEAFERELADIDLVLDLVGGDVPARSWQVLAPGGALVSIAAPDLAARIPEGRRGLFVSMQTDRDRLRQIAEAVAAGDLNTKIAEVVPLSDYPAASERSRTGHAPGKIVIDFTL
jgi:NADPH:quinone reductase-like Zn-dependent oxidoreductase